MKKHGYSKHPLYSKYNQMKQRCYNKNSTLYPSYGGKGITICDEWLQDVGKFIEWAIENGYSEEKCSINRIDPKKGYSPDNCNFMTVSENSAYHPDYSSEGRGVSVYCKDEEVTRLVREYAQKLNLEAGGHTIAKKHKPTEDAPKPAQANIKLPGFLVDVMNGGAFPAMEELTRKEQAILYDQTINGLVNQYRQTKKFDLAVKIRERLDEIGIDF